MNDLIYRGGRKPDRDSVIRGAAWTYDNSPAIAASGVTRESFINSHLGAEDLEPLPGPTQSVQGVTNVTMTNETFAAEYDQAGDVYANMGLTKEQYIRSRRVDEGLDRLSMTGHQATATAAASPAPQLSSDPANAKFVAEYDQAGDVYPNMGLTKEQYIKSRRIDEGLEKLTMVPKPMTAK